MIARRAVAAVSHLLQLQVRAGKADAIGVSEQASCKLMFYGVFSKEFIMLNEVRGRIVYGL